MPARACLARGRPYPRSRQTTSSSGRHLAPACSLNVRGIHLDVWMTPPTLWLAGFVRARRSLLAAPPPAIPPPNIPVRPLPSPCALSTRAGDLARRVRHVTCTASRPNVRARVSTPAAPCAHTRPTKPLPDPCTPSKRAWGLSCRVRCAGYVRGTSRSRVLAVLPRRHSRTPSNPPPHPRTSPLPRVP